MLREAQNNRPIQSIDNESSEVTFTGGISSTPRDPIETAEHETIRRKYIELRDQALQLTNDNQALKTQLTDRLEDFNRLQQGEHTVLAYLNFPYTSPYAILLDDQSKRMASYRQS